MAERRGLLIGARVAGGTIAAGVAAVVVVAVALLPLPGSSASPRTVSVDPAPAAQLRVCPGAVMRLGDASGDEAATAFAIGSARADGEVVGGDLERSRLVGADAGASSSAAPEVLRVPPVDDALVAGAQTQAVDETAFVGLAAASCAEPSGSTWLVGGATTVGRSTFLLLANPTEVPSRVSLEIFGTAGPVSAPGMSGIEVPPGEQRVLSLAGFAPGERSPVVHVSARGGRVVATLQQSIVRGLDAVGVETIGAGADPTDSLVIPGVRILDAVGTTRASALSDWQDVVPIVRLGVPGAEEGRATVRVVPEGDDAVGASFTVDLTAGEVVDIPLDAGDALGEQAGLPDGVYSVFVDADIPIVAAVRASTAVDAGADAETPDLELEAPPSDLAWFAAAPALGGSTLLVVPDGPSPLATIASTSGEEAEVEFVPLGGDGETVLVTVEPRSASSIPLLPGSYRVSGTEGLSIAVSFADSGALAAFVLSPPRPVAGAITLHVD